MLAILLCVPAGISPAAAQDLLKQAEAKAAQLREIVAPPVVNWRYKIGDVIGGETPALNDSSWNKAESYEFTWGKQPIAWLRTTITIPGGLAGKLIAGTRVSFRCGIDDSGILYINGKQIKQFPWYQGEAVLTEKAVPGERFHIAIKGTNTGGLGGLLCAWLKFAVFESVAEPVNTYLQRYYRARDLYKLSSAPVPMRYLPDLARSVDQVDMVALESGKTDVFLESLKTAAATLDKVDLLAKELTVHLIAHAHIDMNWLWLWPETIDVCKNTFSTQCNIMNEYPGFIFSQSQPATYLAMQEHHPDVFAGIKEMIARGQWEAIGTTWVEGDLNMSSGEAIVRSILYGKRYMKQQLGVDSNVCWEPDTFGHPWTLPQILAKSGIKYYYFSRCGYGKPIFWWQSPDGSRVLAYNFCDYGGSINEKLMDEAVRYGNVTGLHDCMWIYGVGDHGGGPTREMLDRKKQLDAKPDFPRLEFSKVADYFDTVLKVKKDFPVLSDELNTIFEGCYTTHADIKRWNRESESLLPCAEKFSAIATGFGLGYPGKNFEDSWRNTCFNQFHDLLCGAAIHDSYDYSRELYAKAITQARSALDASLKTLTKRIATKGPGVPIIVFNPLSWTRTDVVSVPTPFPGESVNVRVIDAYGKVYPARSLGDRLGFTAHDVPALGYKVFWVNRAKRPMPTSVKAAANTLENQFFRVEVDPKRGVISRIYDKLNKREAMPRGGSSALLQVLMENPHGMSAWYIGDISSRQDLVGKSDVELIDGGPAKATITFDHQFHKSQFTQEVSLYEGVPRIDIFITADWREVGKDSEPSPMLKIAFPTTLKKAKAVFEIPFGSIERPANGADVPAQKWIDVSEPGYGVSLLNNCKYGFDVNDNVMRVALLRASYYPDPTPDLGMHEIILSLYPHKGDWRAAGTVRRGYELNEPLIGLVVEKHVGLLPTSKSFVSISEPNLVVTAFKKAEDDSSFILRFYETNGKACTGTIRLRIPVKRWVETDLMENPIGKPKPIRGGRLTVKVGKHEIKTVKLLL